MVVVVVVIVVVVVVVVVCWHAVHPLQSQLYCKVQLSVQL